MRFTLKAMLAVLALVSVTAIAQADGIRDAGSKIRGDYESTTRSPRYYAAPRAAAQAPAAVAQSNDERRSFSAEPGQQQAAPRAATQPSQSGRRYSYQPAQNTRSYSSQRRSYSQRPVDRIYEDNAATVHDAGAKIRAGF